MRLGFWSVDTACDKVAIGDTALVIGHLPRCIERRHIRPNNGTILTSMRIYNTHSDVLTRSSSSEPISLVLIPCLT